MKLKNKHILLALGLITSLTIINNSRYLTLGEKQDMLHLIETQSFPRDLIQKKQLELQRKEEFNQLIERKQQEIIQFLNSSEYARREKKNELKQLTGLNITGYKEVNFNLSFYTDLPSENIPGQKTTDCIGRPLEHYGVANNQLGLGTDLYIEGFGYKEVRDKGSGKYFDNTTSLDVYIPRNPGESDHIYKRRVNNLGRITKKGYILQID